MKKLFSAILAASLMLSIVACGSTSSSERDDAAADSLFTAGTYTGEGEGYGGAMVVEVTVDADKILSVEVVEHSETAGISDPAFAKVPDEIVTGQTLAVDTVAGCTLASQGIIDGATAALEQATPDISVLQVAAEKESGSTELLAKTADVVIIGSGGAGMSAAVEVINAGGSVIVLDKLSAVGGNTLLAGSAMNAPDPDRQSTIEMSSEEMARIEEILALEPQSDLMAEWQATLAAEIDEYNAAGSTYLFDSPALHKLQTYIDGDYVGNPELIDIYGDHALESVEFLEELGAQWQPGIQAAVGATWKRSHTPTTDYGTQGASFVLPQVEYAQENGAEIILEATADTLIMTDGVCTGVAGTMLDGQPFEITANLGVIIATGGFGANVEMREQYNEHWATLDASVQTTNGPQATGDGIVMAQAVGANLVGMEWIQLIPTYGPGVFTPYIENQFYINKEGERFVAEDGRRDVLSAAALEQTDAEFYIISDANTVVDGVTSIGIDVDARLDNGYLYKADTLEELAEQIGVPYEALQASVDEFNDAVQNGNDPLGRTVFDQEFGVGPFYAGLTSPMVHHTMGGIEINGSTQVLDADGNVIPGLYAAGEVTGGIHGSNRLGGNAITDVITYGRRAGQAVMGVLEEE